MTSRIYLGQDQDPAEVLGKLLAMVPDNPRVVVWVPDVHAIDVPDDLAAKYAGTVEEQQTPDADADNADVPALRARLEELGGKVDGRWGEERLKAEIALAEEAKE